MEQIELAPWELWSHAIWWTLIGIALVKSIVYPFGQGIKFLDWIKGKPLLDVIRGILITLVVVKLGEVVIDIVEIFGLDLSKVRLIFDKVGTDPVDLSLIVAIITQGFIYKWRKGKTEGPNVYAITPPPGKPPKGNEPDDDND